ncbi:MAG: heparan-alpha-glucosaminide N-acetyltransferase domain-containing protein [Actinomycetota bacterium]|nr:heparan-alpha-glucosaminide N-acetyltransferase domain-containing protein [Actinomycetota bacterium]
MTALSSAPDGTTAEGRSASPGGRLGGVDLARALAMLGMLVEHTLQYPDLEAKGVLWSVYGRSAPLFVLLAGMGLVLATRAPRPPRTGAMVTVRALLLLLVGMALTTEVDSVILQPFALWFLMGLCVLRLPRSALAGLAGLGLVGGPLLLTSLRNRGEIRGFGTRDDVGFAALADPFTLVRGLTLEYYPAILWLGFFFAGMALARWLSSSSPAAGGRLFLGGVAASVVVLTAGWAGADAFGPPSYDFGLAPPVPTTWAGHWTTYGFSDAVGWTLSSTALSVSVVGAALWVAGRPGLVRRLIAPFVALGQMALSFYLLHFLYLDTLWSDLAPSLDHTGVFLLVSLVFWTMFALLAQQWLRVLRWGPLETVLHVVTTAVIRPRERGGPRIRAPMT